MRRVFVLAIAGGGIPGGQVVGASDERAAYVKDRRVTIGDLFATIYQALGIDPESELRDRLDRPIRLATGRPIEALYTGTAT